jgi:branched-chain amino acid transport system substrate-binding protein
VLHHLEAVEALKSDAGGRAIVARIKEMPADDQCPARGRCAWTSARCTPVYLFEVKKPAGSK